MIYTMLIIPSMMILIGYLMFKHPPKKINWFVGYRTRKSMKNNDSWKFANQYCGKIWFELGLIMLFVCILLMVLVYLKLFFLTETIISIIILFQVCIIIIPLFVIEKKIK